ncbi:PilN domain-containing protein [Pseudoxanthomonas sangjuensis]|uniref:PilN domain-containing protein n=1 Tax=Pseudoxanthomonas sangjuensis TaxID=1503750 RepID=UPI0013912A5A|nr:PilN domain-containing protein [Pseudoxanthomonas sangjuensis]KAF1708266.1 general secretion pathway protein GspL [Pseudoxanthomonas sangjuensis]
MTTKSDSSVPLGADPAASRLQRYVRRYGSGAGGFFAWWKRGLAAWLPARWRLLFGLAPDRLLLSCETDAGQVLRLRRQNDAEIHDLAQVPLPLQAADLDALLNPRLARLQRWLVLPAGAVLRRHLSLPAAAADRLRDVVGFEIDRQTPFAADAVRYDARILQRRADGQLDAELVVAPRRELDGILATLGDAGNDLAGVDVADAAGKPLGVNLLPTESRGRRRDPLQGWNLLLAAVAALALVAAAWQVLQNRRAAAERFAAGVEAKAADARRVAAQRQRLADLVEGAAFLDRTRAARPTALEVMDELSRRLPEGTYLEKLSIEDDRLLLIGLSNEASALVARLEGSKLWRTPALTGALQRDPRSRRDRFSLTAELAGATPPGATDAGRR